jgi:hypothetical protein
VRRVQPLRDSGDRVGDSVTALIVLTVVVYSGDTGDSADCFDSGDSGDSRDSASGDSMTVVSEWWRVISIYDCFL